LASRMIPLNSNSRLHYLRDKAEIDEALQAVLASGNWVMGPEVPAFEAEFAEYCQTSYAVAVTSGTASLHVALLAAGVGPGDDVITVANADISPSTAVVHTGANLIWADIEEDTLNMDPASLADKLTPSTKAVVVAHMYGLPANMEAIHEVLSDRPDITVMEDASLAAGSVYNGRKAGSLGDVGCFSLASGKVLGILGSGGIVTTGDLETYQRLNWVRHYGRSSSPYRHADPMPPHDGPRGTTMLGVNERLDTLQAAVARVKLQKLDSDLEKRRAVAAIYDEVLAESPCQPQRVPEGSVSSYRVYVILVDPEIRSDVVAQLNEEGIQAGAYYVPPDHLHPFFKRRGAHEGLLPVTERAANSVVCLPSHPYMGVDDAWYVATKTREILGRLS